MGYCYQVETLELALVPDGIHLMNLSIDSDPENAIPTKVMRKSRYSLVMPILYRGPYNKAKTLSPDTLVTVFTPIENLSESDRIEIEWALINNDVQLIPNN